MSRASNPFPLPQALERDLAAVHAYWLGLRRAENDMPFADDLNPAALSGQAGNVLLLDVFDKPERFRFSLLRGHFLLVQDKALSGKFIDEVALPAPLEFLRAQASATVEARAPTYQRGANAARRLLPLWGDGPISLLLGAVPATLRRNPQ
jgi:hypothetical protein